MEKLTKAYETVPLIYDYLMDNLDYEAWANYLMDIRQEFVPNAFNALELAAGTGKLAKYFKDSLKNYIISDLSLNMLKYDTSGIQKVCCDMLNLPFKNKFDFIFCIFDSINYLTSEKKLYNAFVEVKNLLTNEGCFTFDAGLEQNSIKHSRAFNQKGKFKKIKFEQRSIYNKETRLHKNIFNFIFEDGSKITEVHRQKIFTFETYFKIADNAGLYVVDCFDAFSFDRASVNSDRAQFILRKK